MVTINKIIKLFLDKSFKMEHNGAYVRFTKDVNELSYSIVLWVIKKKGLYELEGAEFINDSFGKRYVCNCKTLKEMYDYVDRIN